MISSPKTPHPAADVGNVQPQKVASNQRAVALPWFAGRRWLPLVWAQSRVYNPRTAAVTQKVGKSKQVTGYDYFGNLFGLLACCCLDFLEAVEVNGKIVWSGGVSRDVDHPHHTGDIVIPGVLTFRLHWGTPDAPEDWLLLDTCGEDHPLYLDQAKIEIADCYFGNNNATPPTIRVLAERAPRFDGLDENRTREGANGITALAEVIGDDWFGLARPELIDLDSWADLATAVKREAPVAVDGDPDHIASMGYLSPFTDRIQTFQGFLARVLENYDAWARRKEDKIEVGRFPHDGVVPGDLPELSFHDFTAPPTFDAADSAEADVITDAIVTHLERDNNMEEDAQPASNLAARDRLGEIREKQFARPFLVTGYQAREQAGELAKFFSRPELTCSVTIRRERVVGLRAGDRFKLNDAPSGALIVVRIVSRRDESTGGEVALSLVQERGLAPLGYVPVPQPQPTLPSPDLVAIAHGRLFQLPAAFADYDPAPAVVALAERPAAHTAGFTVHFSTTGATYDQIATVGRWALRGTLAAGITAGAGNFNLNAAGFDLALLAPQSNAARDDDTLLLVCDFEVMSIGNVVASGGGVYALNVLRARRGSAADAHAGGAECFVIRRTDLEILLHADFPRSVATRYFKLATYTVEEEQELADALALTLDFDDTAVPSPAPLALTPKAESIFAAWAPTADRTVVAADLWVRGAALPAPVPGTDLPDHTLLASGFLIGGLAAGTTKHVWVQYRDRIGVRSALVGPVNATAAAAAAGAPGATGNSRERRYIRSALVPATPTGNTPAGWTLDIPSGTDALWASEATKDGSGNVVGAWSTPQRLSGSVIFYTAGAPTGHTLIDGDTYFDTAADFRIYRRSGGAWIASFQPMLKIDANNNVSGLVKADGTDKAFVLVADKFQVWNGVSADVPFEIVGPSTYIKDAFIQNVAAGKITAGSIAVALTLGVSGSIEAATGANKFRVDNTGTTIGETSGKHIKLKGNSGGFTSLECYDGGTFKLGLGFHAASGAPFLGFQSGVGAFIEGVQEIDAQELRALSSSDPRNTDAPLRTAGGAWIEKSLDARGNIYCAGDIYLGLGGVGRWLYDANGQRILQSRWSGTPATLSDVIAVLQHHGLSN